MRATDAVRAARALSGDEADVALRHERAGKVRKTVLAALERAATRER